MILDTEDKFEKSKVILTYPFEMTSTPVTQKMWHDEMQGLPTQQMIGNDFPLTNMTWWSAVTFANKLSLKHNLPIVYDLSAIKEWDGDAANGTLSPRNPIEAEQLWKVNAPNGDIYQAKGFRLPTIYEQAFVASDRGRSKTRTFTNLDENNFKQYVWCSEDEDAPLHSVAELLPFIIDGQKFFDLYGNAMEISHNIGLYGESFIAGVNPNGTIPKIDDPRRSTARLMRSNDQSTAMKYMTSSSFAQLNAKDPYPLVTFRLVRSLPK